MRATSEAALGAGLGLLVVGGLAVYPRLQGITGVQYASGPATGQATAKVAVKLPAGTYTLFGYAAFASDVAAHQAGLVDRLFDPVKGAVLLWAALKGAGLIQGHWFSSSSVTYNPSLGPDQALANPARAIPVTGSGTVAAYTAVPSAGTAATSTPVRNVWLLAKGTVTPGTAYTAVYAYVDPAPMGVPF